MPPPMIEEPCHVALLPYMQLRHLRQYFTNDCFRSLVVSFVHTRLDYGHFIHVGLPAYLQRRLKVKSSQIKLGHS